MKRDAFVAIAATRRDSLVTVAATGAARREDGHDDGGEGGAHRPAGYVSEVSTESENRGHASSAHEPKSRSHRHASPSPGSGSTHRKLPLPPKCPNVRGEFRVPVQ